MAQQSTLDFLVAAHVSGMEQMAKLMNSVGALQKETEKLKTAMAGLEAGAGTGDRGLRKLNGTLDEQSKKLRQHRQGTQQLGMQFNDLATSISTGASPMQAMMQQMGQIGYAMSMMKGRMAAIGNFIAGPWGTAIMFGVFVLSSLWDAMKSSEDAGNAFKQATENAADALFEYRVAIADTREELINLYETQLAGKEMKWREAATQVGQYGGAIQEANRVMEENTRRPVNAASLAAAIFDRIAYSSKLNQAKTDERNFYADMIRSETTIANLRKRFRREDEAAARRNRPKKVREPGELDKLRDAQKALIARFESGELAPDVFKASLLALKEGYDANKSPAEKFYNQWEEQDKIAEKFDQTIQNLSQKALPEWESKMNDLVSQYKKLGDAGKVTADRTAAFGAQVTAILTGPIDEQIKKYDELIAKANGVDESFGAMRAAIIARAVEQGIGVEEVMAKLDILDQKQADLKIAERNADIRKSFESIGNAVSDSFKGMITGATSWKDAMRGIIGSVIDELWRLYVVQQIVGFVTKALGKVGAPNPTTPFDSAITVTHGKAVGGYVAAQTPYVVGEKGPELFVPGGSGTIIPNKNMAMGSGGGVTVNVDARGSADPAAVRAQVEQGILQAAPAIIAAAQQRTVTGLRRPKLGGVMQ